MIFGISMVSVNPGWRTEHNHIAEVALRVHYEDKDASEEVAAAVVAYLKTTVPKGTDVSQMKSIAELKSVAPQAEWKRFEKQRRDSYTAPLVLAVSPMNDAQVLDLGDTKRKQVALALELAAAYQMAGLGAQADVLTKWAKTTQTDVQTRSENIFYNGYSVGGGLVGFEIGPRLAAMDVKDLGHGPTTVLGRTSFPVLIMVAIDPEDLWPRIEGTELKEPRLLISQSGSWKPLTKGTHGSSEADRLEHAVEFQELENTLNATTRPSSTLAKQRAYILETQMNGGSTFQTLPKDLIISSFFKAPQPPARPQITSRWPDQVTLPINQNGPVPQDLKVYLAGNSEALQIIGDNPQLADVHAVGCPGTTVTSVARVGDSLVVGVKCSGSGSLVLVVGKPNGPSLSSLPITVKLRGD